MNQQPTTKTRHEINRLKKRAYQRGLQPPTGKQLPHVPIREYDFYDYCTHFGNYHFACTPPGAALLPLYRALVVEPEQLHPLRPCWGDDWEILSQGITKQEPVQWHVRFHKDLGTVMRNGRGFVGRSDIKYGGIIVKSPAPESPFHPLYDGGFTYYECTSPLLACSGHKPLHRHQLNLTKLLVPYRQRFDHAGSIFTVRAVAGVNGIRMMFSSILLVVRWRGYHYETSSYGSTF